MVTRGAWFASYVGYAAREEDSTLSLGLGPAGELYWNFGYGGMVLGMVVPGPYTRALAQNLSNAARRSAAMDAASRVSICDRSIMYTSCPSRSNPMLGDDGP